MKFRSIVAALVLLSSAAFAQAIEVKPFTTQELASSQAAGKPVAVHFHADWCPTCRAQAQVFESLKDDKALNLSVLVANYDTEKSLRKQMGVRVQSTIVVFKGNKETARLAGDTDPAKIRAALQSAL